MGSSIIQFFFSLLFLINSINAQASDTNSGYTGYSLEKTGVDDNSVIYATDSTPANISTTNPPPDVFLNASVYVGDITIEVDNLQAQANLGLQVLSLLTFNAGVNVSVQEVKLQIVNVSAEVLLEARLDNLVAMVNNTLTSLDANPDLANIGQALGGAVNSTASAVNSTTSAVGGAVSGATSGLTGSTKLLSSDTLSARSFEIDHGILYSTNDYGANKHTNRILTQTGSIVDESLDNEGNVLSQQVVGSYATLMTPNGIGQSVVMSGQTIQEVEYLYNPYNGLSIISVIYLNSAGNVIATHVLSETSGGGSSSIGSDELK